MSGSGGTQKLPPQAAPAPVPSSIQESSAFAGEEEARSRKRSKGRRSLILTEGGLGIPEVAPNANLQQKKTLLG